MLLSKIKANEDIRFAQAVADGSIDLANFDASVFPELNVSDLENETFAKKPGDLNDDEYTVVESSSAGTESVESHNNFELNNAIKLARQEKLFDVKERYKDFDYSELEKAVLKGEEPVIPFNILEKHFKKEGFKILTPEDYLEIQAQKPADPDSELHKMERNTSNMQLLINRCRAKNEMHYLADVFKEVGILDHIREVFYRGKDWMSYQLEEYIYQLLIEKTRNPEISREVGFSLVNVGSDLFKLLPNRFLIKLTAKISNTEVSQISKTTGHLFPTKVPGMTCGLLVVRYSKLNRRFSMVPALYVKGLLEGLARAKNDSDSLVQIIPAVGRDSKSGRIYDVFFIPFLYRDHRSLWGNILLTLKNLKKIKSALELRKIEKQIDDENALKKLQQDNEAVRLATESSLELRASDRNWEDLILSGINIPAAKLSGDHLWVKKSKEHLTLGLFDAQGHGRKAARHISAVFTNQHFTQNLNLHDNPTKLLELLDGVAESKYEEFGKLSGIIFQIDTQGKVSYSGAAIPMFLHYQSQAQAIKLYEVHGKDLGRPMGDVEVNPYDSGEIQLHPQDYLILFSDGLGELTNSQSGEVYDPNRIAQIIKAHQGQSNEFIRTEIIKDVYSFVGTETLKDDLSLLIVYRRGDLKDEMNRAVSKIYRKQFDHNQFVTKLQELSNEHHFNAPLNLILARALNRIKQYHQALEKLLVLQNTLLKNPELLDNQQKLAFFISLGESYRKLDKPQEVLDLNIEALKEYPEDAYILINQLEALLMLKRFSEALVVFEKLRKDPGLSEKLKEKIKLSYRQRGGNLQ